jgi:hypothetical protein
MNEQKELEATLAGPGAVLVSQCGGALWRNNNGACVDETGRHIRYGLGNVSAKHQREWTSPDSCGIAPGGLFLGVEWKRPGWHYTGTPRERAQLNCIRNISALGGIAGFVTSMDELERLILQWPR